jgi:PPOX class probable F420-dependent enzyme
MMSVNFDDKQAKILTGAEYVWLTTVREDGMPQPTPVWFIWEGSTFLIFSQPTAQKVKNIRANPRVALSYTDSPEALTYLVIMGEAQIVQGGVNLEDVPVYLEKYREGIKGIGMTPENMATSYSTAIRITPSRVRGE